MVFPVITKAQVYPADLKTGAEFLWLLANSETPEELQNENHRFSISNDKEFLDSLFSVKEGLSKNGAYYEKNVGVVSQKSIEKMQRVVYQLIHKGEAYRFIEVILDGQQRPVIIRDIRELHINKVFDDLAEQQGILKIKVDI